MSIIKRGKSYWVDFSFNDIRYRFRSPDNTFSGAKNYEALLRQRLARGLPLLDNPQNVFKKIIYRNFVNDFFENYVKINNKFSEIRTKRSALDAYLLPYFGKLDLKDISSFKIENFKADRQRQGLSNKYINNLLCVLSKSLRVAEDWGLLEKLPKIKHLKVPQQKYDFLSPEESDLLLNHANAMMRDLILLALHTGLRFGELIALTWQDINFSKNIITISKSVSRGLLGSTKNNKLRHIPLTSEVNIMLENRKLHSQSNLIFPNRYGNFLIQERCRIWLHQVCESANLRNIGWHTFRHTFASRLAENNISMRTIQELLGHSDTNTTMRYAHLSPLVLQDAIKTLEKKPQWHISVTTLSRVPEFETCLSPRHQKSLVKTQKSDVNPILN